MSAPVDLGKYVVYDVIASGGMASVHLGRVRGPAGFARTVAIKRLYAELARDPELSEAFAAEARLAARIRHPNVVSVLDVVAHGDELHLVMELVSAVPLSKLLQRAREAGQKLPPKVAVAIASALLRGLQAAHELDVVHRDVSPQNVLVGADGVPRIVDFGIAKVESQATRGRTLKGKPSYMAPEQLREGTTDRRVDVWAAGVVLWELFTGARLFAGENDHTVMLKVLERPIDAPSRLVPGLSKELDSIVLRALKRDPDARFESAGEMARALERVVPAASASETGAFVASLCGADLEELDRRAHALEERHDEAPHPRAKWRIAALAVALGLLVLGLISLRPSAAPETSQTAEPTPPAASLSPPPSAPPAASIRALASSPAATAKPAPPRARARPPAAKPAPSSAPPSCDPPYVIDSEGFQRMKPECL